MKTTSGSYFGWKGVGFQCGALFNAVPPHITSIVNDWLMMKDPEIPNMTPAEGMSTDMRKRPPEEQLPSKKSPPEGLLHSSKDAFLPSILSETSKYVSYVFLPWLSILLKIKVPTDASSWKRQVSVNVS